MTGGKRAFKQVVQNQNQNNSNASLPLLHTYKSHMHVQLYFPSDFSIAQEC